MALIKWEPFKEIDRFFEDRLTFPSLSKLGLDLAMDIYEEKGNVIVKMALPGVKPEEIEASIDKDVLTVFGKREEEEETGEKDYYTKEIRRGSFLRSMSLPNAVDSSKAVAKLEGGILAITMPATEKTREKPFVIKIS
jgi:HSP20 family protein